MEDGPKYKREPEKERAMKNFISVGDANVKL